VKVAFLHNQQTREHVLCEAVLTGAARHGFQTSAVESQKIADPSSDIVVMLGVKNRRLFDAYRQAGVRIIYLDKGYCRQRDADGLASKYWRFAVDANHPTARSMRNKYPSDRWDELGIDVKPWRERGKHVLIAGSSAKYHNFCGLADPTTFAGDVVAALRGHTERPIVYRPKPTWRERQPIPGVRYSEPPERIADALAGAWVTVTHGSNAAFESIISGIPCISLGDGIAKSLSSSSLADVDHPFLADELDRARWLNALAYHQWMSAEFASGEAWETIKAELNV